MTEVCDALDSDPDDLLNYNVCLFILAKGHTNMDEKTRRVAKQRAAESAAEAVEDGQVVGLGSGSTAQFALERLGDRVDEGLEITGVPTSFQAREIATSAGIELTTLEEVGGSLDIAIDGADQFAGADLIKGGGGAHAREKIVNTAADRLLIVVDSTKESDALDIPVPVEILSDARTTVARSVRELGGEPTLRLAERKAGPVVTDNGNIILDCDFGEIGDPRALAGDLASLPGVVEHGLFPGCADVIYMGTKTGVTTYRP